jgi:hypothetical protein
MRVVPPQGFACERVDNSKAYFGSGEGNRNGFKAALYRNSALGAKVLAIAGTEGTAGNDITADLRIPSIRCPARPVRRGSSTRAWSRRRMSASSLWGTRSGGALAQVLGYWCNRPFVTFNAPGMASVIGAAQWNLLKPEVLKRTWESKIFRSSNAKARGINFRVARDVVGKFGKHMGAVIVLKSEPALFMRHDLDSLERMLRGEMCNGTQSLYDVDPFLLNEVHLAMFK